MINFIFKYKYLLLILLISIFLRFYKLGVVPPSPNWDEAALGYNAYSILKTGRDEYGTFLPITLRSFDDYKPSLYMYLTTIPVALFGLNIWSTRFIAAFGGIFAVLGVYLLTCELLSNYKNGDSKSNRKIALISAFLFSISPWHLQFSRAAFESGIGVLLNIWGIYLFLKSLNTPRYRIFSAIIFSISLYAYHSERVFTPLIVIALTIIWWKQLLASYKYTLISLIAGFVVVLPLLTVFLDARTFTRLSGTSSISDSTKLLSESAKNIEYAKQHGDVIGQIINNRRIIYFKTIIDGYLRHYSINWLFFKGDNARHHAPADSIVPVYELLFLLTGLYYLKNINVKSRIFLIFWLLVAPVAASPTTELPHAIRTLVFLPVIQIINGIGMYYLIKYVSGKFKSLSYVFIFIYALFAVFVYSRFLILYFVHQNIEFSQFWQYGYREAVQYAKDNYDKYDSIVVSTKLEQPHIFFLFFLKYDPAKYISEGGTLSGGFREYRNKFDKFTFRTINWNTENRNGRILYIGAPSEIPEPNLKIISYLNGGDAIHIAK